MSGKRGAIFYPEHVRVARGLLDDAALGRLFLAVMDYAETGETPDDAQEKAWQVCFDLLRGAVDKNTASYQARCEKNRENIRRRWASRAETDESAPIRSNETVSERNASNTKDTYRTEQNRTEQNRTEQSRTERSRAEGEGEGNTPAPAAPPAAAQPAPAAQPASAAQPAAALRRAGADDGPVVAFDGCDLSADMDRCAAVERLIRRYRLPDNDVTLRALLEDVEAHGLSAVEGALSRAALSDTRGGLSVRFYRAVLAGKGRDSPRGGFTRIPTAEEYAAGAGKDGFGWG